jgi:predicted transcriptional regulator
MSPDTKRLLERVASWPQEDQDELTEVAAEIEARRTGIYHLSDDEHAAVRQGMDAAQRGEFVPDDEMEEFCRQHRKA